MKWNSTRATKWLTRSFKTGSQKTRRPADESDVQGAEGEEEDEEERDASDVGVDVDESEEEDGKQLDVDTNWLLVRTLC